MVTTPAPRRLEESRGPLDGQEGQTCSPSQLVIGLSSLVLVLALVAAGAGLLWRDDGSSYTVTSLGGEEVEIYGRDLYRFDTLFAGAGNKGTDAVSLILTLRSVDLALLNARLSERAPRRGLAIFMFASGLVTFAVWMMLPVMALIDGGPPKGLDTNTTLFTTALDIAIIVPAVCIAGLLILRRDPFGYLIAAALLLLECMLAPMIVAQTISQLSAGVDFTAAEIVGPIAGFTAIAVLAIWMLIHLMRTLGPEPDLRQVRRLAAPA